MGARGVDDGGSGDCGERMRDGGIDRDGGSVNSLSGVDRRDFFSKKGFIDGSHL